MPDFIEVERLTKTFPVALGVVPWIRARGRVDRRIALDDVTFSVRRGELFGFLGTNGAGKSTILRVLAGLIVPDSGIVRVGGTDASSAPLAMRRIVRLCTTDERSFYYRLSARRNLEYFGTLVGLAGHRLCERIAAVATAVDLTEVLDLRFDAFSSGMKQRLGIARALLSDPEVLILDEPTRAVDPAHAARIRTFVRRELVERQGKTVLLATNILEEAWELCDRIAVLRRGRIAALEAPYELSAPARTALYYEIIVDRSDAALVSRIRGVPGLLDMRFANDGAAVRIDVTLRPDTQGFTDLLRAVSANGIRVAGIRQRERRPADVFAELVAERPDAG